MPSWRPTRILRAPETCDGDASIPADTSTAAIEFTHHAEKLSHRPPRPDDTGGVAVEALFIAPQDPVIVTADDKRLPAVPPAEAYKLNVLRDEVLPDGNHTKSADGRDLNSPGRKQRSSSGTDGNLRKSMPPFHTNPLFPPLPLYGPPSLFRDVQCLIFRFSSFFLSLAFLAVIVLGALFTSIAPFAQRVWQKVTFRDPDADRPFYKEELRIQKERLEKEQRWRQRRRSQHQDGEDGEDNDVGDEPDPVVCDVGYYARRVGLDVEKLQVQTEDGFIIDLWHVYDPKEKGYTPLSPEELAHRGPELFTAPLKERPTPTGSDQQKPKFPVLLVHGLLQSSGAYCVNDEASLAFYLCKSGYDVWLGNNRCGFEPRHVLLEYADPRMWAWNIRQMGVFDLPALASRVRYETGFDKIGLIAHSQGTTQTLVALAKEQRPDLGEKLTVFCALAPAAYAGPLIGKMYFKFMRVITPAMFRLLFGIHAFIPFMMTMHKTLNPRVYGWLGYKVFSFLFNWTDRRWDRGLKDRMFQFAPVYVSAESMRWWLGRECFAKHKCILSTKEEWRAEEREDEKERDCILKEAEKDMEGKKEVEKSKREAAVANKATEEDNHKPPSRHSQHSRRPKGSTAWYNDQVPPFALWVCGNDALVDGKKLLRRFERGREPHVRVVHSKVIDEYEHLDVIWAMDAVDQVFVELREALWKTCNVKDQCRVPTGCEYVEEWVPEPADGKKIGEGKENSTSDDEDEMESSSSSEDEMETSSSSEDLTA